MKKISFIIPCFNNENQFKNFLIKFEKISTLFSQQYDYEIIFINDKSIDGSWRLISNLASQTSRIKAINLSRKFGRSRALCAGYDHASGDAVIVTNLNLDNLQKNLLVMLQKWDNGSEIVYAHDGAHKNQLLRIFFTLFIEKFKNTFTLFLLDKKVAQKVNFYKHNDHNKGTIITDIIPHQSQFFMHWRSGLCTYAMNLISKITAPTLLLIVYSSTVIFVAGMLGVTAVVIAMMLFKYEPSLNLFGFNVLATLVGFQGILIAVVGHYVRRIQENESNVPLYTIQEFIYKPSSKNSKETNIERHQSGHESLLL